MINTQRDIANVSAAGLLWRRAIEATRQARLAHRLRSLGEGAGDSALFVVGLVELVVCV